MIFITNLYSLEKTASLLKTGYESPPTGADLHLEGLFGPSQTIQSYVASWLIK